MGENTPSRNQQIHSNPVFDMSFTVPIQGGNKNFDDDGRPKRTGTVWTGSAHIITAVIGSGVLSLAWAIAQLGWIAGPTVMVMFSFITYYTSTLLAACYRDPSGKRNYTYSDAVRSHLGGFQVNMCGFVQYLNLFGITIAYTIAASISIVAIKRTSCIHNSDGKDPCHINSTPYILAFGVSEFILSLIPNFDKLSWLSAVAAVMSFTYSAIGLGLGIAKVAENGKFKGSRTGITIGAGVTPMQKMWRIFQAFGDIAFAYSYSIILIEIQDTIRSPPSEVKTMKKATLFSLSVTSIFYVLCGCMGYAAFGDLAPGNLLTDKGFTSPFWLIDIANAAIVIHLVGAFQVFAQPIFALVEKTAARRWPNSQFVTSDIRIGAYNLNLFRLVWRTFFVIVTTLISMILPFFNDVVGFLGAMGYWPLTVYFPVEMYIAQKNIRKWSTRWICLQVLSLSVLVIALSAAAGSITGVVHDLKVYKPFTTST